MREPHDPGLEAIEQRLLARAGVATPAGHRDRVLATVRDTLAGRTVPRATPAGLEAGGTAALVVLALSALLAVTAPWLVVTQAAGLMSPEPRLVAQARAAGVDFPVELVAPTGGPRDPSRARSDDQVPRRLLDAWRRRTLLTGEL